MTIPLERTRAVINTRQFLLDLLNPEVTPRVPRPIRDRANHLLRHYPTVFDMEMIAEREDTEENSIYKVFGKGV